MTQDIKGKAEKIKLLAREFENYKVYKDNFLKGLDDLEKQKSQLGANYTKLRDKMLNGKSKEDIVAAYNAHILQLLEQIETLNQGVIKDLGVRTPVVKQGEKVIDVGEVDVRYIRKILKKKDKKMDILEDYSVYKPNGFGTFSNKIFGALTDSLVAKYPKFFRKLYSALISANVKMLARTYVSVMLFSSLLGFIFVLLMSLMFLSMDNIIRYVLSSFIFAIFGMVAVFFIFYFNPIFTVKSLRKKIKGELPFVAIHMAAVAGSGAQPIAMFNLILKSGEYKAMEKEIKKIVNYVNLFGYNLTTALKVVADTTPSPEFKDLLNGIVNTVETGGSLKSYLGEKSEDIMNDYRLVRKKYIDTLSTYSDIYTGLLIAAPLLFFVTLAIINSIGGSIAGVSVRTLALIGTFVVIPLLNIAFLIFLGMVQPK